MLVAYAVRVLEYWYSHQECFIRWRNCISAGFYFSNGTRQGGVMSPYLFSRYIRNLVHDVSNSGIGCRIADCASNMFVYADDLVLLAPSWEALQQLLAILHAHAIGIDMIVNVQKTVAMVFSPKRRAMVVAKNFHYLKLVINVFSTLSSLSILGILIL